MPDHRCGSDASLFLGDVSLFWYADDIFDLTVQDMAEVGNGVNVEIAALPQFGQRSGIDVDWLMSWYCVILFCSRSCQKGE